MPRASLALLVAASCARAPVQPTVAHRSFFFAGPGGGQLRGDDGGPDSPLAPVVFVHGLAGSLELFTEQLDHQRLTRRAAALDLRGHGQSAPAEAVRDYAMSALAADVLALADVLHFHRFVLVGHSLGGSVAAALAAAHPDRVAGLLLLDGSGDLRKAPAEATGAMLQALRGPEWQTWQAEYAKQTCGQSDDALARAQAAAAQAQQAALAGWFAGALEFDPVDAIARYPGKKLLVHSELNDTPYALPALMPHSLQRVRIAGGRCLHMTAPAEVAAAIDDFLRGVQ